MKSGIKLLLSSISGVLLSFPWLTSPAATGWILLVAWLPLLFVENYFHGTRETTKSASWWGYAFLSMLVWNLLSTWWIGHATFAGAIFAIFANALLMSLILWLIHLVRRNSIGLMGYLAWIVLWLSFEYFHYRWDIEWPWLNLGNAFSNNVKLIQWYEFTGVLGGSLWVLIVNLALFSLLKTDSLKGKTRFFYQQAIFVFLLIFIPITASLIKYYNYEEIDNPRTFLLVQPNIDPYHEHFDFAAEQEKTGKFIALTEKALTSDIDYIVGPETFFEDNWRINNFWIYTTFRKVQMLTTYSGQPSLIIGATTSHVFAADEKSTATARKSENDDYLFDVYNSAVFFAPDGACQLYHKSILVSGVEKMPFAKHMRFLQRFVIDLGGTSGGYGIQERPSVFDAPNGDKIAPVICYESVFGDYVTTFMGQGGGLLVIITNDGWWKNTPGYRQHFSMARLRAVENRRSIARAANTGISGAINQRGDVVARIEWNEENAEKVALNYNEELTFYTKNGDF
ncbi:MAG: apolipoprotein N-acyltransferase, partial [Prolixibacteraceae bacterium]|nr:apolipoprotein N-acyltransferase [Prolixibacteraceae bacterium]